MAVGVGVAVAVGVGATVGVAVAFGFCVAAPVGVGATVGVSVAAGVGVGCGVGVAVGLGVDVAEGASATVFNKACCTAASTVACIFGVGASVGAALESVHAKATAATARMAVWIIDLLSLLSSAISFNPHYLVGHECRPWYHKGHSCCGYLHRQRIVTAP